MRVLLIEDDTDVVRFIQRGLQESGYNVDTASDGVDGLHLATTEEYDVMVIDRMLPRLDGLSILSRLRGTGIQTPILVLSALGDVDDRVEGLKAGGDDYLVKPFALAELQARLEVLLRRTQPERDRDTELVVSDLKMDLLARTVARGSEKIDLQSREFKLLEYLVRHKGQVVTRTMLLEKVWNYHFDPQTNVIDVHISRLRSKIDKPYDSALLRTVRGVGYIVEDV